MKISTNFNVIVIFGMFAITSVQAATVSGGSLILNIDRDALSAGTILDNTPAPSIYLEKFFDASAATKTLAQILEDNSPANPADYIANEITAVGLQFGINNANIEPNPTGRQNRNTTFTFDPNDLFATATGGMGLGGVMRFRVDVDRPNNRILLGDMTLAYHSAQEGSTPGRSSWVINNHIGFDAGGFELFDVTTELIGNSLSLTGNLGFGDGFDHLGATDARLNDARIGTFSLQTTVVPVPAAVWLFTSGLTGLFLTGRAKRQVAI